MRGMRGPRRWRLVSLEPSWIRGKKWAATFHDEVDDRSKTTHFGARGYDDFTVHRDRERRRRYLERHRRREDWDDPTTPGALARWLLWNRATVAASLREYRKRFGL